MQFVIQLQILTLKTQLIKQRYTCNLQQPTEAVASPFNLVGKV